LNCICLAVLMLLQQTKGASTLEAQVDALLSDYAGQDTPGAAVTIIQDERVLLSKGYGSANIEQKSPCRPETNFRLASMTKQFTAACILLLENEGKLTLEEDLTELFPEFPTYGKTITVRHLLSHTSGLLDYEDLIPNGTVLPVLDRDVLRLLMQQDHTKFKPGEKFDYSNSGYSLLSLVVEVRSGMTFAQFLRTRIFVPLTMEHSLAYEQGLSAIPNRAYGYTKDGDSSKRTDQSLTSSVLGDGGIYSSVVDLVKWNAALNSEKLLPKRAFEQAFTPGPKADEAGNRYGFGWFINEYRGLKEVWHSGNTMGFTSRVLRFPEKKFAVILLANRSDAKLADPALRIVDYCLFGGSRDAGAKEVPPDPTK